MNNFKLIEKSRFLTEGEMADVEGGIDALLCTKVSFHSICTEAGRYGVGLCTSLNYESCGGGLGTYRNCGDVVAYNFCSGGVSRYLIPHL